MARVKRDDTVVVLSGKSKGKRGRVLECDPRAGTVLVEGVNIVSRHTKPQRQQGARNMNQGGIVKKEAPIYACKVMRVCPKCDKPTRVAYKIDADGNKTRVCKQCGAEN